MNLADVDAISKLVGDQQRQIAALRGTDAVDTAALVDIESQLQNVIHTLFDRGDTELATRENKANGVSERFWGDGCHVTHSPENMLASASSTGLLSHRHVDRIMMEYGLSQQALALTSEAELHIRAEYVELQHCVGALAEEAEALQSTFCPSKAKEKAVPGILLKAVVEPIRKLQKDQQIIADRLEYCDMLIAELAAARCSFSQALQRQDWVREMLDKLLVDADSQRLQSSYYSARHRTSKEESRGHLQMAQHALRQLESSAVKTQRPLVSESQSSTHDTIIAPAQSSMLGTPTCSISGPDSPFSAVLDYQSSRFAPTIDEEEMLADATPLYVRASIRLKDFGSKFETLSAELQKGIAQARERELAVFKCLHKALDILEVISNEPQVASEVDAEALQRLDAFLGGVTGFLQDSLRNLYSKTSSAFAGHRAELRSIEASIAALGRQVEDLMLNKSDQNFNSSTTLE